MNVLYLTINPNRASTTVPTEGWIRLLRERGLNPVIASSDSGDFQAWAKSQGVSCYDVPLPHPSKSNPVPFARALWKLTRICQKHQIDIIHCNEQDCCPIGSYVARWAGAPLAVSVHFTMARPYCQWAFGGRRCPDRIFFISRGNLAACRDSVTGVIAEDRWRLLYNGLDLDEFRPDTARRNEFRTQNGLDGCVAIGVACALRPRKQLEHLFEAASRVGDERLRVVIAGGPVPGDEAYATALMERGRTELGPRLIELGHLNELRDFYNGIDVFANTSQEEACSISVIESLACGCPVLGYPSKSVDDQILPSGGEIVDQDNVDSMAARLADWTADLDALKRRRADARRQAEERFDIRRLADQLWEEYAAMLRERKNGKRSSAAAAC